MNKEQIDEAVIECNRFLNRVDDLRVRVDQAEKLRKVEVPGFSKEHQFKFNPFTGCKESAAIKRASMDLSRALVKLR